MMVQFVFFLNTYINNYIYIYTYNCLIVLRGLINYLDLMKQYTTYEETKKKFKIYGDPYEFLIGICPITTPKPIIKSKINGREFFVGHFELPLK